VSGLIECRFLDFDRYGKDGNKYHGDVLNKKEEF
jgi:hypothetical protein